MRILIGLVLLYLLGRCATDMNAGYTAARSEVAAPAPAAPPPAPSRPTTWVNYDFKDDLSGKRYAVKAVESENVEHFKFPYAGGSHLTLNVRRHPRWGKDVYIVLSEGQLTCDYGNCRVGWRVDDKPIRHPSVNKPEDGSATTYFLSGFDRLTQDLKGGKRLVIEVSIYSNGSRTFEFNVEGFQLP